jgi:hypothetical protein
MVAAVSKSADKVKDLLHSLRVQGPSRLQLLRFPGGGLGHQKNDVVLVH